MIAFVLRRLLQSVLVLGVVALVAFGLFQFIGDPVNNMLGQDASVAERARLRASLGLDDPVVLQFLRFIGHAVQGEFGMSLRNARPVSVLIAERLPATVELAFSAAFVALALGIPLGIFTALRRRSPVAQGVLALSLLGVSLPTFVTGILLVMVFGVYWDLLPTFGRGDVVDLGFWQTGFLTLSGLQSLVLPAFTLGLFQLALIMRLVRAEMLDVLRADFIRFARARGLPERKINYGHALRNALVPVVTITGLQLGTLIAFAVITETVFQWPGLGLLFIQAVQFADVPVMAAYLLLVALMFVGLNLAVDLLYYAIDPRLRVGGFRGRA